MNQTKEIINLETLQQARTGLKSSIRLQEAELQKRMQQLPRNVVGVTLKSAMPSVLAGAVPLLLSGFTKSPVLKAGAGIAGMLLSGKKENKALTVLTPTLIKAGTGLLAATAGFLFSRFRKK